MTAWSWVVAGVAAVVALGGLIATVALVIYIARTFVDDQR